MRLTDLNPHWVGAGGPGISNADGSPAPARSGIGIGLDCPCGCGAPCYLPLRNPLDGGAPLESNRDLWTRTGEDFATLTLTPSVFRNPAKGGCGWHGFITNGAVTPC